MTIERCDECGFDSTRWTDDGALATLSELPARWERAIGVLDPESLGRRPIADMWSIAEYTDHVRETVFAMRFLVGTALTETGTDLGRSPEPRFDPEPRALDIQRALAGFGREVDRLHQQLAGTSRDRWSAWVVVDGDHVDLHWMARHAVHDVTHHLGDIERLRATLT